MPTKRREAVLSVDSAATIQHCRQNHLDGREAFCLHQKPHRKNDGVWANENSRNICETNDRNDVKVMIFVSNINGIIPIVHAFHDDDGHLSSVNCVSYLRLLQDIIWPRLLQLVLHLGGCKTALHHIAQMQL